MQQDGPEYGTWMYPYERFNSWICKRVLNRAIPEVTVVETYRVSVFRKWNSSMVVVCAGSVQFRLKHIHTYLYLSSLMILFVCKDAFLIH